MCDKRAFVTVGTTEFDALIKSVTSSSVLKALADLGYTDLLLQIGRGVFEPSAASDTNISLNFYRYKDSLSEDFASADLIIGHAGAATCLEALERGKKLVVVVNETLHDNHQLELARQLARDGHLLFCTPSNLAETLRQSELNSLTPWNSADPKLFSDWLDSFIGLH